MKRVWAFLRSHIRRIGWRWRVWLAWGVVLTVVALVLRSLPVEFDREAVIAHGRAMPGGAFLVAFVVLPMLGVPLSLFLVVAGVKYGILWGMVVTTVATGLHNLASYGLTKSWLKGPIERLVERSGLSVPEIPKRHHWWFTLAFAGVPSLPYAVKLYLLALTNIRFRHYFWVGWPTYAASSIVYVGLGRAAVTLSVWWFLLVAAGLLLVVWVVRAWLRRSAERGGFAEALGDDDGATG